MQQPVKQADERTTLLNWVKQYDQLNDERYNGNLWSNSSDAVLKAAVIQPEYACRCSAC
jgi:hypothetical protein